MKRSDDTEIDLDRIKFDKNGLVPVIAQEETTREVLMMAWMDAEAVRRTLNSGFMIYWSRSRQEYWRKGATSGNLQYLSEIWIDCDGDCLLALVKQIGVACHTGERTCFFDRLDKAPFSDGEDI